MRAIEPLDLAISAATGQTADQFKSYFSFGHSFSLVALLLNKFFEPCLADGVDSGGAGVVIDEVVVYFLKEIVVVLQNRSYLS